MLVKDVLVVAFVMAICSHADAAPAADVVVVWAPGHDVAPIANTARARGAAMIDRSPASAKAISIDATIQSGIDAYDSLKLDAAWARFEEARAQLDATGGTGVTSTKLSDLFVYRALVRTQQSNTDAAWEELVEAIVVAPARVFDPARFPPRVLAELERARAATASTGVTIAFDAPAECTLAIDGVAQTARESSLLRGVHWVHASCPSAAAWGRRIEASKAEHVRVTAEAVSPPSETELLVQARTAGARGVVVVEVRGAIAAVRLVGLDGIERDRRTIALTGESLTPVASVVGELLAPRRERKWYESRWVWAAGGAIAFAAILIPTILLVDNAPPTGVRVVGPKDAP